VSRAWNALGREDFLLWKRVCRRIFAEEPPATLEDAYVIQLYGSWRNMFVQRPRVRLDGVYVSRNTYVRTGISEWRREKPVHLCVYYRYLRFIKGGKFVYRTSPYPLKQVVKSLIESKSIKSTGGRHQHQHQHETQHVGRYRFMPQSGVVQTAFRYQNSFGTEVRSKLRLRGTTPGAFNRLDIENIVTWDRDRDVTLPMLRLDEEENDILGERRDHKTSDTAYVFVPFEQVSAQFTSRHSTPRRHDATTLTHAHRRSPTLTDAHRRSPTLTDAHHAHPRSPTLTDAHRRSPTLTDAHRRSPTLTDAHRRSPPSPAGQHPRAEPRRRQARLFRRRLTNPNTLRYCILVYYIQNGASDIHSHQTSIKTSSLSL
jgi:F-box protein 9